MPGECCVRRLGLLCLSGRQARRGEARRSSSAGLFYLLLVFLFELLQLYRSHCICHQVFHLFLIVFFQACQILRELNRSRVRKGGKGGGGGLLLTDHTGTGFCLSLTVLKMIHELIQYQIWGELDALRGESFLPVSVEITATYTVKSILCVHVFYHLKSANFCINCTKTAVGGYCADLQLHRVANGHFERRLVHWGRFSLVERKRGFFKPCANQCSHVGRS